MKTLFGISIGIAACLALGMGLALAQQTAPPSPCVNPDALLQIEISEPGYYPLGFRPNLGMPATLAPGEFKIKYKQPPAAWDWRSNGGVTSVKNQGAWPTCWIFATIGEVESKIKILETPGVDPDYSEMDVLEGVEEGTRPPGDSRAGGHTKEVANHLTRYASLDETDNPYSTAGTFPTPPITNYWNPPKGTPRKVAREWHDLGNVDQVGQVGLLKTIIHTEGPVTASVRVDTINNWALSGSGPGIAFNGPAWNSDWVVPYLFETLSPDHAILIVGWDDNKAWYGSGGFGAWLVKNSWGTSWGSPSVDAGYFWIAYGSARIGAQAGSFPKSGFTNYDSDEILLHYDQFGSWGTSGWAGQYDVYMLNVFTPPDYGRITAVEFWAPYQNLDYEARVYDTWSGTSSSPTDQIGGTASGSLTDAGYYSVAIDPAAKVHSGDDIYVVVRLKDSSNSYTGLIPYEVDATDTGYTYLWFTNTKQSETNKCYVRYDTGMSWASMNTLGDVGVRARFIPPITSVEDWFLF